MTDHHNIRPAVVDRAVPIDQLDPHPLNARQRDARAEAELRDSLTTNGQYRAIVTRVVRRRGGKTRLQVLAGHGTLEAARQLGWTHIAAEQHTDVDDQAAARIVAVDNRTSDLAYQVGYDTQLLAELIASIGDLTGSGYDALELEQIQAIASGDSTPVGLTDPDDAPDAPDVPTCRPGEFWLLGPHRLVCGDATQPETWDQLLGDHLADIVWTDPPYGVAYEGGTKKRDAIRNDALDQAKLAALLRGALGLALEHTNAGAVWYVAAPHGPIGLAFSVVLHELEVWRHSLVWVKNNSTFGKSDYHHRHEPIYYGWSPGGPHHKVADRKQDTIWEVDRPARSVAHPTMKPVELIARALRNSTDPGQLVVDCFAGSGSTLIAAHQTGRRAALVELDPAYADVIARRWQEHTGILPTREDGTPVDFTTRRS